MWIFLILIFLLEYDLNHEIDSLAQTCTCQKRKIAELEVELASTKLTGDPKGKNMNTGKRKDSNSTDSSPRKGGGEKNKAFIDKLTQERNEFQIKCKTLQEQLDSLNSNHKVGNRASPDKTQGTDSIKRNLKEKEDKISKLEKNIQNLTREKHELITKLESLQELKKLSEEKGTGGAVSLKSAFSKAEKERDMARGDVKRLEDERDALRQRLKQVTEAHTSETAKLQKVVSETEKKFRELENERRELVTVQGSRRATINNLEQQIESLSSQLRTTQSELDHIHTLHSQLKTLHEQTDGALADTQGQLHQIENEYAHATDRIRELENSRAALEREFNTMKNDLIVMKGNLASIDGEKDHLLIEIDNKTERIANLEMELNTKHNKMMSLEKIVADLKQKLSLRSDDLATKDYLLQNHSSEISSLKRSLDEGMKDRSIAVSENKRLQEDFSKVSYECRCVNNELDRAKREIEDLKTQLQQYVFEIKRAEDLISKKEIERSEMLDQFRNLSEETTNLESNNHTLESQAMEVRSQLTSATNHIHDMESKIEQLNSLNKDYERQISQMTKQIASLETQVRQSGSINKYAETEISDMKCLCVKLDEQKDTLKKEVKHKDEYTNQLQLEKEQLKAELNKLQDALHKETSNIGSLENLLATCRQETVEQRLLNQELQSEILRLKSMIQELQNKLKGYSTNNTFGAVSNTVLQNSSKNTSNSHSDIISNKLLYDNDRTESKSTGIVSKNVQCYCINLDELSEMQLANCPKRTKQYEDGDKTCDNPKYCINLEEIKKLPIVNCPKRMKNEGNLIDQKYHAKQSKEEIIIDEVCLCKQLHCIGTQQTDNVSQPEVRNVGIQQIFRTQPEYVEQNYNNTNNNNNSNNNNNNNNNSVAKKDEEHQYTGRSNSKAPDRFEEIKDISLSRFYSPNKAQKKDNCKSPERPRIPDEPISEPRGNPPQRFPTPEHEQAIASHLSVSSSYPPYRTTPVTSVVTENNTNNRTICLCIPVETIDSNRDELGNKRTYCTCMSSSCKTPRSPLHDEPRLPLHDEPRLPLHDEPRSSLYNEPRLPLYNEPRSPLHNEPRLPLYDEPRSPLHDDQIGTKNICSNTPDIRAGTKVCPAKERLAPASPVYRDQTVAKSPDLHYSPESPRVSNKPDPIYQQHPSYSPTTLAESELNSIDYQKKDPKKPESNVEQEKRTKSLRFKRNTEFWEDDPSEKPVAVPEPSARKPIEPQQQYMRGTASKSSHIKILYALKQNALDHETFHSDKPLVVIEPSQALVIKPEHEKAMQKRRRTTQHMHLEKLSQLRKSLNLDKDRTKLIYRTDITTTSPFQSEKHYRSPTTTTNVTDDSYQSLRHESSVNTDYSNTIIVIPEACKQNIVDNCLSPKSITFSPRINYKTKDDSSINMSRDEFFKLNIDDPNTRYKSASRKNTDY